MIAFDRRIEIFNTPILSDKLILISLLFAIMFSFFGNLYFVLGEPMREAILEDKSIVPNSIYMINVM